MVRTRRAAMAARKRKKKASAAREYKLRLPPALSERIEKLAATEGKPQSRIIIDDLESIPYLRSRAHFEDLVKDMEYTLSLYSSRVISVVVSEELLNMAKQAVQANRAGNIGELRRLMDKLTVHLIEQAQI